MESDPTTSASEDDAAEAFCLRRAVVEDFAGPVAAPYGGKSPRHGSFLRFARYHPTNEVLKASISTAEKLASVDILLNPRNRNEKLQLYLDEKAILRMIRSQNFAHIIWLVHNPNRKLPFASLSFQTFADTSLHSK